MTTRPMTLTLFALLAGMAVVLFVPTQFLGLIVLWTGPILLFSALFGLRDI